MCHILGVWTVSRRRLKIIAVIVFIGVLLLSTLYYFTYILHAVENIGMAVEFNDHAAAAWVALEKKWFRDVGLNVTSLATFRTGLQLAAAITRGDIDVAWACLGPIIMAYARGVPLKIVCMAHLHGYALVAKPEYESVEDLNGKVIACPGPGSPCWLLLRMVMEKYNIEAVVRKMSPHTALNALLSGQIDAAALPEHYVTLAKLKGMRVLVRSQSIWPTMPGSVLVVKEEFLKRNPKAVKKLVEVTVRALNYINKHFEDSARIVAKKLNIPYEAALESMRYLDYTYEIDLNEVQKYINLLVKYGAIDKPFNASDIVDTRFLKEVVG